MNHFSLNFHIFSRVLYFTYNGKASKDDATQPTKLGVNYHTQGNQHAIIVVKIKVNEAIHNVREKKIGFPPLATQTHRQHTQNEDEDVKCRAHKKNLS